MATNGTDTVGALGIDEEILGMSKAEQIQVLASLDRAQPRRRAVDESAGAADSIGVAQGFALAPLVNKIAFGIARGLVVAIKELEDHIASETRKVGDTVDRRLDTLQTTLQELSNFVGEQRSTNSAVQGQLHELTGGLSQIESRRAADVEGLRAESKEIRNSVSQRIDAVVGAQAECNARQSASLEALGNESKAFAQAISEKVEGILKELGVHQEDIGAIKSTLAAFSTRVDGLVERLDRQADAVRSMCSAYSQRETELEQLVDGLARLRAFPTPVPGNGL
jgi:chromosome segregation ATPase